VQTPIYQIDAFAADLFGGNPAAVCPLERWLDDRQMQSIAAENNLAETAFFVRAGDCYQLRWFTPTLEVDLCGHATLASAFVVFQFLQPSAESVRFQTKSGELVVHRAGELLEMDFPAWPPKRIDPVPGMAEALGKAPGEYWESPDYMMVFDSEDEVRALKPDMAAVARLGHFAVIVTAPGREVDFVSRFFAPASGIDEDPVTGRAHCTMTPYWSKRLGKSRLQARQISPRGGELFCEDRGERVGIAGKAVRYLEGTIHL
jgi:predicted PhzF superfamily epimerase YddE/YHI9